GPSSALKGAALYTSQNGKAPGQRTDAGQGPIFISPAVDDVVELRFYASHRDRFDDPKRERIEGAWEYLLRAPTAGGSITLGMPADLPVVLAGFDRDGRVASWTSPARDRRGRQATFYAFAGDHYSSFKTGRPEFCTGCHPGHSNPDFNGQRERVK